MARRALPTAGVPIADGSETFMSHARGRPWGPTFLRLAAVGASVALLFGAMVPAATAKSNHHKTTAQTITVHRVGTSHLSKSSSATASTAIPAADIQPDVDSNAAEVNKAIPNSLSYARVKSAHVPRPATSSVSAADTNISVAGLNHFDQHAASPDAAGYGTQFSLEPPDQGLCVGNGYIVETVNTAIRVRDAATGDVITDPKALNAFFGLGPEYQIDPSTGEPAPGSYGPFTSDPKCYYDSDTGRFFVSLLEIDTNPTDGSLAKPGASHQLLAVSKTGDPTGAWWLYEWETTNDSGSSNCPCFGDQPLIGADANGFYVTTNEFPIFNAGFNGANVYALSKSALASGAASTPAQFFNEPSLAEGYAYSLQPTTTPPGGSYETGNNGTEYFLSALDFNGTLDNRIALWALTNTASLDTATPDLALTNVVMHSEVYGQPPAMTQPNGPTPLKDLLNAPKNPITGVPMGEHLNLLNSNDDRMNQTVYADGMVWGAVNTVVKSPTGPTRTGIAYFIVTPSWSGSDLGGSVTTQGYVAVKNNNVVFPAIAANAGGQGIMSFTLVGRNYYPSAAYVTVDATHGAGSVQLVAKGAGPADGFSGYLTFDPADAGVARWGDYGAAVAAEDGTIWFAAETINQSCSFSEFLGDTTCGGTRTFYANWGTWIANVTP